MCSHSLDANSRFFGFATIKSTYIDMGAHKMGTLIVFRVNISDADSVFLTGGFNSWREDTPMLRDSEGIWEVSVPESLISDGDPYKYKVYRRGTAVYMTDPYSIETDGAPFYNSIYRDMSYAGRAIGRPSGQTPESISSMPLNIYEIAADKWKRGEHGELLKYSEIAHEIAPYASQMGYTHIGLTQVIERYFDSYNSCEAEAYYSAGSRHGGASELLEFVRIAHKYGIGVFLDWHIDPSVNMLSGLGRDFFLKNAVYWIDGYGFDGIKISVGEALDKNFIAELCNIIKTARPSVCLISDSQNEDTACCGFDLVIDREWANSSSTGIRRGFHSREIKTFERPADILAVSRTDASIGKKALMARFGTDEWRRFALERAFTAYQMTYRGKKLTYMGSEIAQSDGNAYAYGVDWNILNNDMNAKFQLFCSDLNWVYLNNPELWSSDAYDESVIPVKGSFGNSDIYVYERASGENVLAVVVNFSPAAYQEFVFMLPGDGTWIEIFNSDAERYGGSGVVNGSDGVFSKSVRGDTKVQMRIPPLGVSILKRYEKISGDSI